MRGALEAGADYVDLGGLFHMTRRQLELDDEFRAAGRTAILGLGSAPGKTNLLARLAAERVGGKPVAMEIWAATRDPAADGHPFPAPYSVRTLLDELRMSPMVVRGGELQEAEPLSGRAAQELSPTRSARRRASTRCTRSSRPCPSAIRASRRRASASAWRPG